MVAQGEANGDPDQVKMYEILSQAGVYSSLVFTILGTSTLTSGILNTARDLYMKPLAYRNIRRQDLDLVYTLDEKKYRSLQNVRNVGAWTGTLPGVLSLMLSLGEIGLAVFDPGFEMVSKEIRQNMFYANAGLVAIPPIWSHLAGGRFSFSLFLAGLAADALMAGAYYFPGDVSGFPLDSADYTGADIWDPDRILDMARPLAGYYMLLAASIVRLTAGAFDAKYGWTLAMERNHYKAQIGSEPEAALPREEKVSFEAAPLLDPRGGIGLLGRVSWK